MNSQEKDLTNRATNLLKQVGLADKADALGDDLSYGQQKLVAIARLLAADTEVLLLDEPIAGVNPGLAKKLLKTVRRLANEGRTIAIIEHKMDVVRDVADWVHFMDDGQIIESGTPDVVLANPKVRRRYTGLEVSEDQTAKPTHPE